RSTDGARPCARSVRAGPERRRRRLHLGERARVRAGLVRAGRGRHLDTVRLGRRQAPPHAAARSLTSLIAFFSLTYIVSWICFAASAALSGGTFPASSGFTGIGGAVLLLGIFAPALVALALTAR